MTSSRLSSDSDQEHNIQQQQNQVSQQDIDFINRGLNFGRSYSTSTSQQAPSLAIGSTIRPQRYAVSGSVQQHRQQSLPQQPTQQQSSTQQQQNLNIPQFQTQQNFQQPNIASMQSNFNIQLKIPEPKPYSGEKREGKSWLSRLERYFAACGLNEMAHGNQMCAIACALMSGSASKWLDRLTVLHQLPTTFTEFKDKFLKQYCILDDENTARDKLKEAKQRKNVQQYISYYDGIIVDLPNATEDELIHAYVYGLKPNIRGLVKAQLSQNNQLSLQDVMTLSLQYEDSTHENRVAVFSGKSNTRYSRSNTGSGNNHASGVVPMELGTIKTRYNQNNNKTQQIKCYKCGKLGHIARNYRFRSNQFNHIDQACRDGDEATGNDYAHVSKS